MTEPTLGDVVRATAHDIGGQIGGTAKGVYGIAAARLRSLSHADTWRVALEMQAMQYALPTAGRRMRQQYTRILERQATHILETGEEQEIRDAEIEDASRQVIADTITGFVIGALGATAQGMFWLDALGHTASYVFGEQVPLEAMLPTAPPAVAAVLPLVTQAASALYERARGSRERLRKDEDPIYATEQ